MNIKVSMALCFIGGAAVGAGAMWFGVKQYYKKKADMEIDWVRGYYCDKVAEVERTRDALRNAINTTNEKMVDKSAADTAKKIDKIDYNAIYVPQTGPVSQEQFAAETRMNMIEIIDINQFGNDDDFPPENNEKSWRYFKLQDELYDPMGFTIDPLERFGKDAYDLMKKTDKPSVYLRDHSINIDIEVEIYDEM